MDNELRRISLILPLSLSLPLLESQREAHPEPSLAAAGGANLGSAGAGEERRPAWSAVLRESLRTSHHQGGARCSTSALRSLQAAKASRLAQHHVRRRLGSTRAAHYSGARGYGL